MLLHAVPPCGSQLYTAIVGTDNTVKILVDNEEKKSASLLSASCAACNSMGQCV